MKRGRIASNIIEYDSESDRVASVTIQINLKNIIKIIQCYIPTSTHTDIVEEMYDNLRNNCRDCNNTYKLVICEFNAKLGEIQEGNETYMGTCIYDEKNGKGSTFIYKYSSIYHEFLV